MADSWQTIEQAAVSLRLSVRTVNRHIAAGKLQSRLVDGRREVLVDTRSASASANGGHIGSSPFADGPTADAVSGIGSDFADSTSVTTASPQSFSHQQPSNQSTALALDQETVLALADNAAEKAEMAVTAYQALARLADTQAQQVRRSARLAWGAVAAMAAIGLGVTGWATHRVTRLAVERESLVKQSADYAATADRLSAEREALRADLAAKQDALRAEVSAARQEAARTEGRLAALIEQDEARKAREALLAVAAVAPAVTSPPPATLPTSVASDATPATQPADTSVAASQPPSDDDMDNATFVKVEDQNEQAAAGGRPPEASDNPEPSSDAGEQETELASGNPSLVSALPAVELEKTADASDATKDDAAASVTSDAATRPIASDTTRTSSRKPKTLSPTTRPAAPRRKVRPAATRPATTSDRKSAAATDEP